MLPVHFKIMTCLATVSTLVTMMNSSSRDSFIFFYCKILCDVCYFDYAVCHSRRVAKSCEKKSKIAGKLARLNHLTAKVYFW